MNDHVAWVLELAVKQGELDNFKALATEMVESTRGEPGTVMYEWSISDDGSVIHIYEWFADSRAVLAHLAGFSEKFAQRFLTGVDPTRLTVYGAPNDEAKEALGTLGPVYMAPLGGFTR
jgi:quinol monooxygenase YgiN